MILQFKVLLFVVLNHISLLGNFVHHLTLSGSGGFQVLLLDDTLKLVGSFDLWFKFLVLISHECKCFWKVLYLPFVLSFSWLLFLKSLIGIAELSFKITLHKAELFLDFCASFIFLGFLKFSDDCFSLMDLPLPTLSKLFVVAFKLSDLYQLLLPFLWESSILLFDLGVVNVEDRGGLCFVVVFHQQNKLFFELSKLIVDLVLFWILHILVADGFGLHLFFPE